MSEDITIWHNPRCSKSRQTMQLLKDAGVSPIIIEYLKETPEASEIKRIIGILDLPPRDLMRVKEALYKANGLGDASVSEDDLIAAMVEHPILIERPVVIKGDRAVIGRPPENVQALLNE